MKQDRISKRFMLSLALSITVVVCAAAVGAVSLKNWRPLRESGTTPSVESQSPKQSSSSQPQWNGNFTDFLICGIDNTRTLTDVIMIVGFNNTNKKNQHSPNTA